MIVCTIEYKKYSNDVGTTQIMVNLYKIGNTKHLNKKTKFVSLYTVSSSYFYICLENTADTKVPSILL